MVSSGVVALLFAAFVQAAYAQCSCSCNVPAPCAPRVRYEESCEPGAVVERNVVVQRPVTETFTYPDPVYSRQCYTQSAGVDRQVTPSSYETAPVCETQETVVSVPTTDVEVENTPLCKKVCTTNEYVIQIPIKETTCTSSPMCKQTVRSQDNVLTTVARKTACAKQTCSQNIVTEKPVVQTVCQNYRQDINKVGTQTVLKSEVQKTLQQLPSRRVLKAVVDPAPVSYSVPVPVSYSAPCVSSAPAVSYSAPAVSYSAPAVSYSAPAVSYSSPSVSYSAPCASSGAISYSTPSVSYSGAGAISAASSAAFSTGPSSCLC